MKILRSFIVSFVVLSVLSMSILPVSAYSLTLDVTPAKSRSGAEPAYTGTLNFDNSDGTVYRYLEVTIPAKYQVVPRSTGIEGTITILAGTSEKVKIEMRRTNAANKVNFYYRTNGVDPFKLVGNDNNNKKELDLNNGGSVEFNSNVLTFVNPTTTTTGSIKLVLGSLGPVTKANTVKVEMELGAVKNPTILTSPQSFTWNALARERSTSDTTSSGSFPVEITLP